MTVPGSAKQLATAAREVMRDRGRCCPLAFGERELRELPACPATVAIVPAALNSCQTAKSSVAHPFDS
jgi:hypothetical protein